MNPEPLICVILPLGFKLLKFTSIPFRAQNVKAQIRGFLP